MEFSQEIIALRTRNHLTQTNFAKRIGVCAASVRGWESGQYKPSIRRLEDIDAIFGTQLAAQAAAEMPEGRKRRRRRQNYINLPEFTDDVEVFKSVITLLKLFMLLNPEGREKALRKITAYANQEQYQIPRMRDANKARQQEQETQESQNTQDGQDATPQAG